jgi:fermentation-respiration switch protein FrsA (DUF1100 family)
VPVDGDSVAVLHLSNSGARYTILYSHGNAEDLGDIEFVLRDLHALGFAVIGYDYRGYGASTGGPTTARNVQHDAEAVYEYAVKDLGIAPQRLVVYGRSIGSGPAMHLASTRTVGGVILESAFTSAFRVVTRVRVLPFDRFPNVSLIRKVRAPVLVMHGRLDEVIPFEHGRRLYEKAREPKQHLWVDKAHHNDFVHVAGRAHDQALLQFRALLDR